MSDGLAFVFMLVPSVAFLFGFAVGIWIGRHHPEPTHD